MGLENLICSNKYFVEIIKSLVEYIKCDIKLPVHANNLNSCWAVQMPTTEVVFLILYGMS